MDISRRAGIWLESAILAGVTHSWTFPTHSLANFSLFACFPVAYLSSFSLVAERLGLLLLLSWSNLEGHQGLPFSSQTHLHSSPSENASAFSVALVFMESASMFHRQWPFLSDSPFRWHFFTFPELISFRCSWFCNCFAHYVLPLSWWYLQMV